MHYNEKADTKQFEKYSEILGKNAPSSFQDFQRIKYGEDWDLFKSYTKSIENGEVSPLADFALYQEISSTVDKHIIGIRTKDGVQIKSKSYHFVNRVIGSVIQKRSGVELDDVIDSLTHPKKIDTRTNTKGVNNRYIGERVAVSLNPATGNLIQTNPIHRKK